MVLVRLHLVKVATLTDGEAIVAVELDQGGDHRVLTSHALHAGNGVARLQGRAVPPVRVVEWLLALPGVDDVVIAADEGVTLHNPHKLLTGVVEVQLDLVAGRVNRLSTSELQSLDQVLVRDLGELTTLIRVEVDVVDVERGGNQVRGIHTVADRVQVRGELRGDVPAQVVQVVELQVDTNLVVLQSNQRESQPRVAAEPELQRDVQSVLRGAAAQLTRAVGLTAGTVVVAVLATLDNQVGQLRHVANHLGVAGLLSRLLGELIPNVHPVAIVLVDTLATNLELNIVDQVVPNPVQPAELGTRAVRAQQLHRGKSRLQVNAVDQVTITLDGAGHLVTKPGVAVERIFNRLHRKVGVTTIHNLEEGNLRITSQIHILSTIGHELHQTTTSHLLYPFARKKICQTCFFGVGLNFRSTVF